MQSTWKFHFLISKDQQRLAGPSLTQVQFLRGGKSDCPRGSLSTLFQPVWPGVGECEGVEQGHWHKHLCRGPSLCMGGWISGKGCVVWLDSPT